MFKYLLKPDQSKSSSLAWILLKNIKFYFEKFWLRIRLTSENRNGKAEHKMVRRKKTKSKCLAELFQEFFYWVRKWDNRDEILFCNGLVCVCLWFFLYVLAMCRIFQCNFVCILQNVCNIVCLSLFSFKRSWKEIIYVFVCEHIHTYRLNTELCGVVYWACHSCNKPISSLSFVPISQESLVVCCKYFVIMWKQILPSVLPFLFQRP